MDSKDNKNINEQDNIAWTPPTPVPEGTYVASSASSKEASSKDVPFSQQKTQPIEDASDDVAAQEPADPDPAEAEEREAQDATEMPEETVEESDEPEEEIASGSVEFNMPDISLDSVAKFVNRVKDGVKSRYANPLQPVKIIDKVFKAGQSQARDWGPSEPREMPNYYDVYISSYDWDTVYGIEGNDMADKVSAKVKDRLRETDYRMQGNPVITFKRDATLVTGEIRVEPAFGTPVYDKKESAPKKEPPKVQEPRPETEVVNPTDTPETPEDDTSSEPEASEETAPGLIPTDTPENIPGTKVDAGEIFGEIVGKIAGMADGILHGDRDHASGASFDKNPSETSDPEQAPAKPQITPPPATKRYQALLSWEGGSAEVTPGAMMGVLRRNEEPIPDIQLPKDIFDNSVSQDHGVFLCKDGTWFYESHGRYGTSIQLPGSSEKKEMKGNARKQAICDGTLLMFADELLPVLRFTVF